MACGLCLPHCPTYGLLHDESESPRGRLSLMLALAKNELPLSDKLELHLARCLDCRACEKVCPSYVSYGLALDSARALIEAEREPSASPAARSVSILQWLVEEPGRVRTLGKFLWLYHRSGLQWLLRTSHLLKLFRFAELEANLLTSPPAPKAAAEIYPTERKSKGKVTIFTGCLTQVTDQQTLISAIRLLNRLGYEVHVPPDQGCCGALHLHSGLPEKTAEFMGRNIKAFAGDTGPILCAASGCTATLGEYAKYRENDKSADRFSARVTDLNQFLAGLAWSSDIAFRPLKKRIAVHDPCSLTNVLRQEDKPYALLTRIPGAEIIPLPENSLCCGAAGTYHLTQTRIARQLRAPKIDHLRRLAPDILVTSNSGCAMYLAAGIREAGLAIEVIHPVVLLERQIQNGATT
ncbi:MAG: heterodisulfide reductase-related iron-sulfur binding cluster [Sulfuricaulis sp.]|nr:heterodisulfide reductase-related iron-sulfur binding cluster [Sulfuricaulis sp.]